MKELRPALTLLAVFTLLCGLLYPALVTVTAGATMSHQANGSMMTAGGKAVGSELIGQTFVDPGHFWSRPSAVGYDAKTSSGTNLGPSNMGDVMASRIEAVRAADPGNTAPIPVDLVTASSSGLDPHISPAAAGFQVGRVARARGLNPADVSALVERHTEGRTFGILGEPRVNVLKLNLALEAEAGGAR